MNWNPDRPISELPEPVRKLFSQDAYFLYQELKRFKPEVILVSAPQPRFEGHKIRMAVNRNPDWYSDLYWKRSNFRRDLSLRALDRIRNETDRSFIVRPYKYDAVYREMIQKRINEYLESDFFPNKKYNKVRRFLGNGLQNKLRLCENFS